MDCSVLLTGRIFIKENIPAARAFQCTLRKLTAWSGQRFVKLHAWDDFKNSCMVRFNGEIHALWFTTVILLALVPYFTGWTCSSIRTHHTPFWETNFQEQNLKLSGSRSHLFKAKKRLTQNFTGHETQWQRSELNFPDEQLKLVSHVWRRQIYLGPSATAQFTRQQIFASRADQNLNIQT